MPETVEVGPSSPAPAANYFWVPGCWMWNNDAYGWRAGYWHAGQPNWVWIPDRYSYSPGGAIFVNSRSSIAPRVTPTVLPARSAALLTLIDLAANTAWKNGE